MLKLLINLKIAENLEGVIVELKINKKKWLVCYSYFLQIWKLFIVRWFQFWASWKFYDWIWPSIQTKKSGKRCSVLEKSWKAFCIDLILTNRPRSFHGGHIIETGPSDFHKMYFKKRGPRFIHFRDYKRFNTLSFR